jgi:hypothetical protein
MARTQGFALVVESVEGMGSPIGDDIHGAGLEWHGN